MFRFNSSELNPGDNHPKLFDLLHSQSRQLTINSNITNRNSCQRFTYQSSPSGDPNRCPEPPPYTPRHDLVVFRGRRIRRDAVSHCLCTRRARLAATFYNHPLHLPFRFICIGVLRSQSCDYDERRGCGNSKCCRRVCRPSG